MLENKQAMYGVLHNIEQHIPQMLHYFHVHTIQAQIFAFLVSFIEALPVIGTIIPGSITMTMLGILIGAQSIPFMSTLLMSCLGAYIGDTLGFACGRLFQHKLINAWPFKKHPEWLTKSESFFSSHGRKSIIIGRFAGPIRSTVPMVAGMLKMSWRYFLSAAVISASLWSIVYIAPGILLGSLALTLPPSAMAKFIGLGLLIIFSAWFVVWLIVHFFSQLAKAINTLTDRCWSWLNQHHHSHTLIRFITNQDQPDDHKQLLLLSLGLICLLLYTVLLLIVAVNGPKIGINTALFTVIQSMRTPTLNTIAVFLTNLGFIALVIPAILLMCGIFIYNKQPHKAYTCLAALLLSGGMAYISRHLFFSPRPNDFVYVKHSSSFVSGHCTMAITLFGLWAYFSTPFLAVARKNLCYIVAGFFIVLIGFSRLLLGAHWFTDVIGAWLLGLGVLLLMIMLFRRHHHHSLKAQPRYWFWLSPLLFVALWLPYSLTHYQKQLAQSQQLEIIQTISLNNWWHRASDDLPHYRNNRLGHPSQPLNLQWLGKLSQIKQALQSLGFNNGNIKLSVKKAINDSSNTLSYQQPLLPWLHRNQPAVLLMTKTEIDHKVIAEIRLWKSFVKISQQDQPLWIGAINFHAKKKYSALHSHYYDIEYQYDHHDPLQTIAPLLQYHQYKVIQVTPNNKRKMLRKMQWNGTILLIRPATNSAKKPSTQSNETRWQRQ